MLQCNDHFDGGECSEYVVSGIISLLGLRVSNENGLAQVILGTFHDEALHKRSATPRMMDRRAAQ